MDGSYFSHSLALSNKYSLKNNNNEQDFCKGFVRTKISGLYIQIISKGIQESVFLASVPAYPDTGGQRITTGVFPLDSKQLLTLV